MNSSNDTVIYLKKSVKSLLRKPSLSAAYSDLRHFRDWKRYLAPGKSPVSEGLPWITFAAIDRLNTIIRPDMEVFEYGSGGSTLFWASRVRKIVSVEHDRGWFEKMRAALPPGQAQKIHYLLVEPQVDATFASRDFHNPDDYISSNQQYRGMNFEAYAKAIDAWPDRHFDLIVVDGRARPSCIKHAIPKLRANGWLMIDNSDRLYYLKPFSLKRPDWKEYRYDGPVPFMKEFSRTTLYQKCF
jgi:hypothetical protein